MTPVFSRPGDDSAGAILLTRFPDGDIGISRGCGYVPIGLVFTYTSGVSLALLAGGPDNQTCCHWEMT
jgi:hypothetical protein